MGKVYIIGIGPGAEEYLPPIARREIEKSDCLIAAGRTLSLFEHLNKERVYLDGHFDKVIAYIKKNKDKKRIALLVSGDAGLYSLLGQIERALEKEDYVVIPGISALQLAFARIGESWQDVKIISLHGRAPGNLAQEVSRWQKIFLFTDPEFPPQKIAGYLLKNGVDNRRAIVFENLSYPDERIVDTNLKILSEMKGFGLCVMVIRK